MKWEEILAAITGSGQTPEQFATELQKGAQPFFQAIFDKGHGAATVKATAKETELTGRITALETERDAAVTRATDAEKKVPEIATIRAQYDEQIKTLKEKHKTELQTRDETAKSQRIEQAKQSTINALVTMGVDKDKAELEVEKEFKLGRFVASENGVDVYQTGKQIPLAPADGKTGIDLLADEINQRVEAKWKRADVDRGTGAEKGGATQPANQFEKIRQEVKERQKQAAPDIPLDKRLGAAVR
jgi:hypothetical protein